MNGLQRVAALIGVLAVATPGLSSANQVVTVKPAEIDIPLVNPYCGWGIWAGPRFFDSRQFSIDYNTRGFGDDASAFRPDGNLLEGVALGASLMERTLNAILAPRLPQVLTWQYTAASGEKPDANENAVG